MRLVLNHFFSALILIVSSIGYSQTYDDTLIGLVDQELIKININNAGISTYLPITNYPVATGFERLTWSEPDKCYYVLSNIGGVYQIGKISEAGAYTLLGPITVPAQTLFLVEGISYNRNDNAVYVSASLNGGITSIPQDFWSETLIRIDITTLVGTIIGTYSHVVTEPEADMLTFDDNGNVVYRDGQPGGAGFNRFYKQIMDMSAAPAQIYGTVDIPVSDLTVKNNTLYYSSDRFLMQIDLATNIQSVIGQMFTAADFNGLLLKGLTWKPCGKAIFNQTDTTACIGDTIKFDVGDGANWNYLWSDGTTDSLIDITIGGVYWVELSNADCVYSDTINIVFSEPYINAGVNDTICEGDNVTLTGSGLSIGAIYTWDQAVVDGVPFIPLASQNYIVQGLDSIGCLNMDTIEVVVTPYVDSSFSYPSFLFCTTSVDVVPINVVSPNGVFTSTPAGLSIDVNTGVVSPVNSAANTYDITYTVGSLCLSDSTLTINILDFPTIDPISDINVCEGDSVVFLTVVLSNGATFGWTNSNLAIGLAAMGSDSISDFLTTLSGTTQIANVSLIPAGGNCVGNPEDFVITVNATPIIGAGLDQSVCLGDFIELTGTSDVANTTFTWDQGIFNNNSFSPPVSAIYTVIGIDGNGCSDSDNVAITVNQIPTVNAGPDVSICLGNEFEPNVSNPDGAILTWDPKINDNQTFSPSLTTTYTVTADLNGCLATDDLTVLVSTISQVDFSFNLIDQALGSYEYQFIEDTAKQNINAILWDFGDGSSTAFGSPTHIFQTNGGIDFLYKVSLTVNDNLGCVNTVEHFIELKEDLIFYVPNSFTPDGTGFNNTFQPVFTQGFDPYYYKLIIFNRAGEIIFVSYDASVGWDGMYNNTLVQTGAYVWMIEFDLNSVGQTRFEKGHITVIR